MQTIVCMCKVHGTVVSLPPSGRKHKLSPSAERKLVRVVKRQPRTTKKQVCNELQTAGTRVALFSVKHVLHHHGLRGCHTRRKPFTFALYRLRRRHFEIGDKAGKMLTYQLKQQENKHSIPAIRDSSGNITAEQALISSAFKEFYSKLYQAECQQQEHKIVDFLEDIPLPKLSTLDRDELEAPVRGTEILTAIKKLANGKSPEGDSYIIEFYKQFQSILSPVLTQLYNNIIEHQSMPVTMRSATISVLPKSGKDHLDMGNFRPLSLLNNDYKVFAKVLALRLEKVITSLAHIDQVGFIPGRLAANNMRRLLQVSVQR